MRMEKKPSACCYGLPARIAKAYKLQRENGYGEVRASYDEGVMLRNMVFSPLFVLWCSLKKILHPSHQIPISCSKMGLYDRQLSG